MREQGLNANARHNFTAHGIELYIWFNDRRNDVMSMIGEVSWKTIPPNADVDMTPFVLSLDAAQRLIDDLYHLGLRPTNNKFGDETIRAQSEHIADLRAVTFALLTQAKDNHDRPT